MAKSSSERGFENGEDEVPCTWNLTKQNEKDGSNSTFQHNPSLQSADWQIEAMISSIIRDCSTYVLCILYVGIAILYFRCI